MQVFGTKGIPVEFFTFSKSYNMPGWRVSFIVGNPKLIATLSRNRQHGIFSPISLTW